jgi:hypothetical protein
VSVVQASPDELAAIDGQLAATEATDLRSDSAAKTARRAGLQLAGVLFLFVAIGGGLVFHGAHARHRAAHKPMPML